MRRRRTDFLEIVINAVRKDSSKQGHFLFEDGAKIDLAVSRVPFIHRVDFEMPKELDRRRKHLLVSHLIATVLQTSLFQICIHAPKINEADEFVQLLRKIRIEPCALPLIAPAFEEA